MILSEGKKVTYNPGYKKENGIIKKFNASFAWVVYHCGGDWENYEDYTAAKTPIEDLEEGWAKDADNANYSTNKD